MVQWFGFEEEDEACDVDERKSRETGEYSRLFLKSKNFLN